MDLLDFDKAELYFDQPLAPEIVQLLEDASAAYGTDAAEMKLLNASRMAPQHLMVLKATGYVHLRLGNLDTGREMLEKLVELDSHDRIGGKALLEVLQQSSPDTKNPGDTNNLFGRT